MIDCNRQTAEEDLESADVEAFLNTEVDFDFILLFNITWGDDISCEKLRGQLNKTEEFFFEWSSSWCIHRNKWDLHHYFRIKKMKLPSSMQLLQNFRCNAKVRRKSFITWSNSAQRSSRIPLSCHWDATWRGEKDFQKSTGESQQTKSHWWWNWRMKMLCWPARPSLNKCCCNW